MNHKRRRPKNRRAGCLLCKPWKMNHAKEREKASVRTRIEATDAEIRAVCL